MLPMPMHPSLERGSQTEDTGRDSCEPRIGLALSGGGFRAAFFHLGVLKRLEELGLLDKVDVISAVSGGAIVGAYYGLNAKRDLEGLIEEFRQGTQSNIRTLYLLKSLTLPVLPRRRGRTFYLERLLDSRFFRGKRIADLCARPHLIINATNLATGRNWKFSRRWMGDYRFGFTDGDEVRVATAVSASAAVPVVFSPVVLDLKNRVFSKRPEDYSAYREFIRDHARAVLVDGGIYDNLGIRGLTGARCTHLIISDASSAFESEWAPGPLRFDPFNARRVYQTAAARLLGLSRKAVLQARGVQLLLSVIDDAGLEETARCYLEEHGFSLEKSKDPAAVQLESINEVAYFKMDTTFPDSRAAVPKHIAQLAMRIRTDLDTFSDAEIDLLMYLGYCQVGNAIQCFTPEMAGACMKCPEQQEWERHFDLRAENELSQALAGSSKRCLWRTIG